jgi:ABC-2 type transport system ATP-binding protein
MQYAIEVNNVKKRYGKFEALKGVSFKVKKGEFFGLLGPNGAGKSTMINILSDLLRKDSGTAKILGSEPRFVKERMNTATAYTNMNGALKVHENLRVFAKLYNVPDTEKRVNELIDMFGLNELRNDRTNTLSSGESTRLNICKGLLNNPEVLLLDECTVGLDPDIASHTRKIIKDLQKNQKTTILFTSHIMHEVEQLCDRIAFLNHGKIIKIGTTDALKRIIDRQIVRIEFVEDKKPIQQILNKMDVDVLYIKNNVASVGIRHRKFKIHEFLHPLIKAGIKIKDLHIRKPNLDDVFIKMTGKQQ